MLYDLSPYPHYFCPDGVGKPAHCPHVHALKPIAGKAPDGGTGTVYAPEYREETKPHWRKTSLGWWILMQGQKPQDLARLDTSPRILRWHVIDGVSPDHKWRVPVLLTPNDPEKFSSGFATAIDRVWSPDGWAAPPELRKIQESLMAITMAVALADDLEARNKAVYQLVVDILALGHHVSFGELELEGWLSVLMVEKVIFAAVDRPDLIQPFLEAARGV